MPFQTGQALSSLPETQGMAPKRMRFRMLYMRMLGIR